MRRRPPTRASPRQPTRGSPRAGKPARPLGLARPPADRAGKRARPSSASLERLLSHDARGLNLVSALANWCGGSRVLSALERCAPAVGSTVRASPVAVRATEETERAPLSFVAGCHACRRDLEAALRDGRLVILEAGDRPARSPNRAVPSGSVFFCAWRGAGVLLNISATFRART